ncbi:hypothetical protein KDW_22330 [Dictyobacter vulcani]|uniref:Pentapeptide repeat-containing protein n=1 Tax=Dictyobacter vulcani TaxID=2607529 RepID=A0A5J4KNZ8_9CHLR|nr:hypothetical protein KDW_22330 [Dictyobacter vulcani]
MLLILLVCAGFVLTILLQAQNVQTMSQQTQNTQIHIASEQQQEAVLQNYLNKLTDLLVHDQLLKMRNRADPPKIAADALTLDTFSRVNPERKAELMRFIYHTKVISNDSTILDMQDVDVSKATMGNIDLQDTNLLGANISGADLHGANMSDTLLTFTNLSQTNLTRANFQGSDMHNTNLTGADLAGANLRDATGLTQTQLSSVKSLAGATMPDGSVHR